MKIDWKDADENEHNEVVFSVLFCLLYHFNIQLL